MMNTRFTQHTRTPGLRLLVLAAFLTASAIGGVAGAQELILSLNAGVQNNTDSSYDPLSVDDLAGFGHYGLSYELFENLYLGAEYEYGEEADDLFGIPLRFVTQAALLVANYEYPLTGWFRPHVSAGLGAYWSALKLTTATAQYTATAAGFEVYGSGGFSLVWQLGDPEAEAKGPVDRMALSFRNEFGWLHRTPMTFDSLQHVDHSDTPAVPLGEVTSSGWTWASGIGFRYEL